MLKFARALLAASTPSTAPVPCAYRIGTGFDAVRVEAAQQMYGPDLWAVRRHGNCLNKQGEWEWEPMPSSRDDEFMARCRFASAQEAIDAAMAAQPSTATPRDGT